MRGREIVSTLEKRRSDEHRFVKWWRKENDFADYDLIERFMDNTASSEEIDGLDLLTMDEMWQELKRIGGGRINLIRDRSGDVVEWERLDEKGKHMDVCVYTPETIMEIFDAETRGNPICS